MDPDFSVSLAAALADLAVEMHGQPGPEAALQTIVTSAVKLLPGISWAGISLVERMKVTSQAPTDDVARSLDRLQSDLGEGPVFTALREHRTIAIPELQADARWPRFADAATAAGVRTLMAFRLYVRGDTLAVLTLYGPRPHMFSEDTVMVGEIFAQHAAVALAGAVAEDQMQRALASRDVIGRAKGILMHRDNVSSLQAFAMLTRASQDTNIRLVDVARFVVDEFEKQLPQQPPGG